MDLLTFVFTLAAVGILLGALRRFGPKIWIEGILLEIIFWVIVVVTVWWALNVLGVVDYIRNVKMPHVGR
jgi:hypothetical protein